ncbi:MAG: ASKHA domain-containing protein [Siculibacillus sp.]|nr:ASKHA domain-containing protein [Siculibacillus sp.]
MNLHHPPHEHRLSFPALDREITARADETVFQAARRQGLRIVGACGGRGTCGACTVRVTEGSFLHGEGEDWVVGRDVEGTARTRRKWVRACKVTPRSDCVIEVAPRSLAPVVRADVHRGESAAPLPLVPTLRRLRLTVPPPSLADGRADAERLVDAAGAAARAIDLAALRPLPDLLRRHDWSVDAVVRDARIVAVRPPGRPLLGLAVDLGTTNVVGHLVDLETGRQLARLGLENPQVAWGADLVARLNHAIAGPAAAELRDAAVTAIAALAHDLAFAVDAEAGDIVEAVVCGNTAMQHLALGLPVRQLGRSPFVAALREAIDVPAADFPLPFAAGAIVHVAPNIGGFVGSDHVTALIATRHLWDAPGTTIVMDIGTNTEISLVHDGRILSASCPSGPALEGGHIAAGMRAAEGAIERVSVVDGRLAVAAIGGRAPVGICGSGVIDMLASLRRAGIVDARGRLHGGHPDTALDEAGKPEAVAADGVIFTQADVRAVQLAKAAIMTGVELLLRDAGIEIDAVDRFVVAGAFGAHVDVSSAVEIGLFPDIPRDRIRAVGNAAGVGVARMLTSREERCFAADLARRCRYVELSSAPDFQKRFMHNIGFAGRSHGGKT